ncbi:MAG: hypothetical protein C4293_08240 [Nitrospiraceae bacterium]
MRGSNLFSSEQQQEFEQRRQLIQRARKGDSRAKRHLLERYQVRIYTGKEIPADSSRTCIAELRQLSASLPSPPGEGMGGWHRRPSTRHPPLAVRAAQRQVPFQSILRTGKKHEIIRGVKGQRGFERGQREIQASRSRGHSYNRYRHPLAEVAL